ncbi:MAG: helix-turn-helix domain-containing protein [Gemmatimonadota bacterium]|nr:helix-turn-helix domain-containing protein [Gemmatimonadota bacterium]
MPWLETDPVRERRKLIVEWLSGDFTVTELSERHGVSRRTAYKWIDRYEIEGPDGLRDRSRRPTHCPWATDPEVLDEACRIRMSRRTPVGAKKVRVRLLRAYPAELVPSERTLHKHFTARDLVKPARRRRRRVHPGRPTAPFDEPNAIWSADFKGQFKTRDGIYCYPLTIQDGFSRYLLACQGLVGTRFLDTKRVFSRLFHEFGLPRRIRSDNGVPFASLALGRLSRLSIWWIELGILPDLIEPASPQQNGRHERMHRTLKNETAIPPAGNRAAQQRRFNEFRTYFNDVRPHEAIAQKTPSALYQPSPRSMPSTLAPPDYPAHFEVRKVSTNGGIRWHAAWINVSQLLGGKFVGLEDVGYGVWSVYFHQLHLGWLHIDKLAIVDHDGSTSRSPRL